MEEQNLANPAWSLSPRSLPALPLLHALASCSLRTIAACGELRPQCFVASAWAFSLCDYSDRPWQNAIGCASLHITSGGAAYASAARRRRQGLFDAATTVLSVKRAHLLARGAARFEHGSFPDAALEAEACMASLESGGRAGEAPSLAAPCIVTVPGVLVVYKPLGWGAVGASGIVKAPTVEQCRAAMTPATDVHGGGSAGRSGGSILGVGPSDAAGAPREASAARAEGGGGGCVFGLRLDLPSTGLALRHQPQLLLEAPREFCGRLPAGLHNADAARQQHRWPCCAAEGRERNPCTR
eukprot:NODE_9338_length_1431_cov_3.441718.p1 GENE.NODE_9338_length_1431_cov_3.441718~~NODE_9338_length_1431_cov_3.441718.p1  ORF type:complete len:298 (-),score=52.09 NODE_9338_length_1431_cov_3.441718:22-915(-)